jgi:hypothetical protein
VVAAGTGNRTITGQTKDYGQTTTVSVSIKLIESEFKFSLDENYEKVVGSDGKEVKDVIQNWLDKNENYKRAKTTSGTGAKIGPQGTPQVANSGFEKFVDKLIKKH